MLGRRASKTALAPNFIRILAGYLAYPGAKPIVTSTGDVIGTTNYGGTCSTCGTIYEYTP
jgi:hypothetical protein